MTENGALALNRWPRLARPCSRVILELPEDAQASAQIKGRARFENFIETLGRRLQKGQSFLREIPEDVDGQELSTSDGENEAL